MATIFAPSGEQLSPETFCPLCGTQTTNPKTAAGPSGPNIPPVLVCESHLLFRGAWLKSWADTNWRPSMFATVHKKSWLSGCYVEHRDPFSDLTIASDLGRHSYARWYSGSVLVVAEKPMSLASPARKQWLHFSRALRRTASGTLHAPLRQQYALEAKRIEATTFDSHEDPTRSPQVVLVTPDDLSDLVLPYSTVYVTCEFDTRKFPKLILGAGSLVVDYTKRIVHNA